MCLRSHAARRPGGRTDQWSTWAGPEWISTADRPWAVATARAQRRCHRQDIPHAPQDGPSSSCSHVSRRDSLFLAAGAAVAAALPTARPAGASVLLIDDAEATALVERAGPSIVSIAVLRPVGGGTILRENIASGVVWDTAGPHVLTTFHTIPPLRGTAAVRRLAPLCTPSPLPPIGPHPSCDSKFRVSHAWQGAQTSVFLAFALASLARGSRFRSRTPSAEPRTAAVRASRAPIACATSRCCSCCPASQAAARPARSG
jgi:hypothetical protein